MTYDIKFSHVMAKYTAVQNGKAMHNDLQLRASIGVTRFYSSRPFLCALASREHYSPQNKPHTSPYIKRYRTKEQ